MGGGVLYLLCATLLTGCLYEYPDIARPEPFPGTEPGTVALTVALALNIDFEIDAEHTEQFVQTHDALLAEGYAIRYIVDLHQQPDNGELPLLQRTHRIITTEATMPPDGTYRLNEIVTLTTARYVALVWVDFVPAGSSEDFHYRTGNLQAVTIDGSRPYRGYHISKDAFTAGVQIDLTSVHSNEVQPRLDATVQVKRPFALYRIVTTDVAEYRNEHSGVPYAGVRPDTTRLTYQFWFPMGFNAYRAVPDNFDESGVHYAYHVPETNGTETEVELAADFVFVNPSDDYYFVDFDVETPAGDRISRHSGIRVNLQRNRMTVIRGKFLTYGSGGGGTGIDFNFDEEIVIRF